jgi:SecD/SecF fusion protein
VTNLSLNQTFMRSVNTSLVVLLPIGALLVFGGQTLKDFAFALFVGVACGAYSSIFVAAPLLAVLKEREPRYQQIRARAMARLARPSLRAVPSPAGTRGPRVEEPKTGRLEPAPSPSRSLVGSDVSSTPRRGSTGTTTAKRKKPKPKGKPKPRRR